MEFVCHAAKKKESVLQGDAHKKSLRRCGSFCNKKTTGSSKLQTKRVRRPDRSFACISVRSTIEIASCKLIYRECCTVILVEKCYLFTTCSQQAALHLPFYMDHGPKLACTSWPRGDPQTRSMHLEERILPQHWKEREHTVGRELGF